MNNLSEYEVVEYIKKIVLIYLDAPEDYFTRKTRQHDVLKVKQYACYFSKRHTSLSNQIIAEVFRLKNHSSIISLVKKIEGYALWDKQTKRELQEIENIIKLKGLSKNERINFDKHYYINMNNFKSVLDSPERAVVFIGYEDEEIIDLLQYSPSIRNHINTAKFILENLIKDENMPEKKEREKLTGNRISELLHIKGIKAVELAHLIGISEAHLSRIINNKNVCISLPIAIKIAQGLDEPVENVFIFEL
jgi:DNA-binding XRE family transcriptional regulator